MFGITQREFAALSLRRGIASTVMAQRHLRLTPSDVSTNLQVQDVDTHTATERCKTRKLSHSITPGLRPVSEVCIQRKSIKMLSSAGRSVIPTNVLRQC